MKSLEQIRTDKGVSKTAICRHLGISRPTYDAYESNPQTMKVSTAKSLAEYLGVDVTDIFFLSNSK